MKEAYYFSHDSNASQDEKILNLRADHGWEGYGVYWAIIERLRDTEGYKYKVASIKGLAASLGLKPNNIINDVIYNYDLFENDGDFFWSKSLINRMQIVEAKRQQAKSAGINSGKSRQKMNGRSTDVQPSFNDRSTDVENQLNENATDVEQGKERKGKEILNTHTIARESKIEILKIFEESGLDLTEGGGDREFEKFMAYYDQRSWKTTDGVRVRDPVALARTWTPKQIQKPTIQRINGNSNSGKQKLSLTDALKAW